MLRVIYGSDPEELLRALIERASPDRSLLAPLTLIVPNRPLQAYVELFLAREAGIAVNLQFRSLPEFLHSMTGAPAPESTLLDSLIRLLFDDSYLAHEELRSLRDYIHAARDDADASDRRRVQLARKLARLFYAYEVHRPELVECWRAGLFLDDPDFRDVESWQRRLWLDIESNSRPPSSALSLGSGTAHVFGISYFARSQVGALGRIAQTHDVFVYALNPCQELWEVTATSSPLGDSPKRYERRGSDLGPGEVFSLEDPFRLSNPGENPPLRLWGKPGRESLRLLNALTGCELLSRVREHEGTSLLHQLQRDIASRRPERDSLSPKFRFDADESIVFLECDNPRREVEAVASEIWSLLSEGGTNEKEPVLRFEDVAVLVVPSRASRYQTLIDHVFRKSYGIPFSVVDLPVARESAVGDAALRLLETPLKEVSAGVLRAAVHPNVAVEGIHEWVESLAHLDPDLACESGLAQLAMDACLHGFDEASPIPAEARERATSLSESFVLLRSLLADAREASRVQMTVPAWMDFVAALLSTYVQVHSEADARVLRRCLESVSALADLSASGRKVRYPVAHELASDAIRRLEGSRGTYLCDGVSVSAFVPMRAIPFRVVFVLGLGEGQFPARDRRDRLDLRRAHRRAGDVGKRDEDRYLFLQTLLCARDRIYFSWASRDGHHPERIRPASILSDLIDTLSKGYVARECLAFRRHPPDRSDDLRTTRALPEAARERNARKLGEHLRAHLGCSRLPALSTLKPLLPEPVLDALRWPRVANGGGEAAAAPSTSVDLESLRQFLECPLQGSARFHLRLRETKDEWTRRVLPLLHEALVAGGHAEAYDRAARRFGLQGSPAEEHHLAILALCRRALCEASHGTEPKLTREAEPNSLFLKLGSRRIEIARRVAVRLEARPALVHLDSKDAEGLQIQKQSLRGFLDHVFSCASGSAPVEPYLFVCVNAPPGADPRLSLLRFAPIEPLRARSYLEDLASELLSGIHDYLLPCESVLGTTDGVKLDRTSSASGPVPYPEDYRRLSEPEREAAVRRRFGLYFETLLPVGERA